MKYVKSRSFVKGLGVVRYFICFQRSTMVGGGVLTPFDLRYAITHSYGSSRYSMLPCRLAGLWLASIFTNPKNLVT